MRALLILVILASLGAEALAAGLLADPDRTRLGANETLTLRLIADGGLKGEPDLSPLEADFEILSRSTSSRTTIVNGDMSQSTEWVLELAPRHAGDLLIPSLAIGGEHSQAIPIQVVPADQVDPAAGPRPVFLDTEVGTSTPYVQEPFTYKAKVYYREPPRQASLSEPKADGATIVQQGGDRSYAEQVDGTRYTVIERHYLVVPQRSGSLTIESPRLEAVLVPDIRPREQRSPFADLDEMFGGRVFRGMSGSSGFSRGRRVVEHGPDQTVEVRAQPAGTTGPWLPAQSIQLADQWTPSPPQLRVGEPVTRTLTITAQGATGAQLPTLDAGSPDGVKLYPEPATAEDVPGSDPPASVKTTKLALVPTRAGPLTLPEIRLHWWDTVEDRQRVSVIPARVFQVAPAAGAVSASSPALGAVAAPEAPEKEQPIPVPSAETGSGGTESPPISGSAPSPEGRFPGGSAGVWPWLSLLLGLGWLLTLGWILRQRGRRGPPNAAGRGRAETATPAGSVRAALGAVRQACARGDALAAREALLTWGGSRWPRQPPTGLAALAERLGGGEATAVLAALDRTLYAPAQGGQHTGWDGDTAWARLEPLLKAKAQAGDPRDSGPLPLLYPRGI